jgi:hypothetical protein
MPTASNVLRPFLLPKSSLLFCRMLLWNLRLYSHRSGWFEIIAALFYELNLKRLISLDSQDVNLDEWRSSGAQEREASQRVSPRIHSIMCMFLAFSLANRAKDLLQS